MRIVTFAVVFLVAGVAGAQGTKGTKEAAASAKAAVDKLDAARVWDMARTADGTTYAATGDEGKVFRRDAKDNASWNVVYDATDSQALSLAVLPENRVVVGTGPNGQIVDVTDPNHAVTTPRLDPDIKYIWDLASDAKGNLYIGDHDNGAIRKVDAHGTITTFFTGRNSA